MEEIDENISTCKILLKYKGVDEPINFDVIKKRLTRDWNKNYSSLPFDDFLMDKLEDFEKEKANRETLTGKLLKGLPKLGNHSISISQKPGYGQHSLYKPYRIVENCHISFLDEFLTPAFKRELQNYLSVLWMLAIHNKPDHPVLNDWNEESQIQNFVNHLLTDIIKIGKLETVKIYSRVALATKDLIPDLVIFKIQGSVIGIVEVKIPSKNGDDLSHEQLYNQISSYMFQLKYVHGLRFVIALVTTYNEWKFLWLPECEALITATTIPEVERICNSSDLVDELINPMENMAMEHVVPDMFNTKDDGNDNIDTEDELVEDDNKEKEDNDDDNDDEEQEEGEDELEEETNITESEENEIEPEEVRCSCVYRWDQPELIPLLLSVLVKMTYARRDPPRIFSGETTQCKYGLADKFSFRWVKLKANFQTTLKFFPKIHKFYLLQDYHGGKDGRVWLASSVKGSLAVVKLSSERTYIREAELWRTLWCKKVYVTRLLDVDALIMPYAFHGYIKADGYPSFRTLKAWNMGNSTLEDFVHNGTRDDIDENSIRVYLQNPLRAAKEAIRAMIKAGFRHNDLKWSHVALLPYRYAQKWKVKPILIDLHDVTRLPVDADSKQEFTEAYQTILDSISVT
jgi:hypothetical protein